MVVLMRKLAVCFTTCDVLCALFRRCFSFLLLFFSFSKSDGITHVFSYPWGFFFCWTGSMSCVYVYMWEFCVLSGLICVCVYVYEDVSTVV